MRVSEPSGGEAAVYKPALCAIHVFSARPPMRIQMKYRNAPSRVKAANKASMAYADIAASSRVFINGSPARDVVGEIELQNDTVAFECRREWREHLRSADAGHRRAVERLGSGLRRDHQFRNIAIAGNRKLNS